MFKRIQSIVLMVFLVGGLVAGCSSGKKSYDSDSGGMPQESHAMKEEMGHDLAQEGEIGVGESPQRQTHQKLIYTATMNIEVVEKVEPLIEAVQRFVDNHDGYIENMDQYRRGYDPITQEQLEGVFMKIRIPHEHYNKTLQTIADLGSVVNKSSRVEDVTLQYSDIESTLKMYKVEQGRLLEMLENETTDIKDMIEIEKRLSEVRIELEKQESARRALDSQINYDTIELEMTEVRRASDVNNNKNFTSRIKTTFIKSIDGVIIFFQKVVLSLTYMLIPLMILGAVFGVLYVPLSKIIKGRKDKPDPKDEKNAD